MSQNLSQKPASVPPPLRHILSQPTPPARVVIMGAGGFVGRHTAKILQQKTPAVPLLTLTRKEVDLLQSSAHEKLAALLQENDTLVVTSALAPCKSGVMLIENLKMIEEICKAISIRKPAHLIYISSDAVYQDSMSRLTEHSPAQPDSFHGIMHLAREVMLRNSFSGSLAIVRPTLIYGAADPHNGYGPNQFIRKALKGESLSLFGQGEELRDHIAVEEVAEIIHRVILHRSEGIINAVTGNEVSFGEIAKLVRERVTPKVTIQENPRKGPIPHNGFRCFDPLGRKIAFPDFKSQPIDLGIQKMIDLLTPEPSTSRS